jgi:hypothetical protein
MQMSRCRSLICPVMTCEPCAGCGVVQFSKLHVPCSTQSSIFKASRAMFNPIMPATNAALAHVAASTSYHASSMHATAGLFIRQNGSIGPGVRPKYCRFSRLLCRWCASSMLIFPSATLQCQQALIDVCINHGESFTKYESAQCHMATTDCHERAGQIYYRDSGLASLGTSSPSRST